MQRALGLRRPAAPEDPPGHRRVHRLRARHRVRGPVGAHQGHAARPTRTWCPPTASTTRSSRRRSSCSAPSSPPSCSAPTGAPACSGSTSPRRSPGTRYLAAKAVVGGRAARPRHPRPAAADADRLHPHRPGPRRPGRRCCSLFGADRSSAARSSPCCRPRSRWPSRAPPPARRRPPPGSSSSCSASTAISDALVEGGRRLARAVLPRTCSSCRSSWCAASSASVSPRRRRSPPSRPAR